MFSVCSSLRVPRRFIKALLCVVTSLPLMFTAEMALAQVIPSTVQPEHVGESFNKEPAPVVQPPSSYVVAPQTATVPVASALNKEISRKFVLKSVQIDESTVYPAGTFEKLFADKIGTTTSIAELRVIARAITTRYRKDGYVLSQAVIPNQNLNGGVFHVRVVEGFVDKVIVKMDNPNADRRGLIAAYGEKISQIRPLNTAKLERYMLLANDLPGIKAKALLQPSSTTFGAADLVIEVTSKQLGASFTSDNRGSKYLGPGQEQATVTENSLAGFDERTTIRGINTIPTSQLHFIDIQHEEQLGTEGTRLLLRTDFTRTNPGDTLKSLDLSGESDDYAATISHPILRSRAENITVHGTLEERDTNNYAIGDRISNDRITALRGGASFDTSDFLNGSDLVAGEISQGVTWFNATGPGVDRTNAAENPNFIKMNMDVSRLQNLPHGFSFLTAATGQMSANALPVGEQLALGGVGFGQAYDSGEISGDQGIAGKAELRYGQQFGYRYFDSYQLYTYYDIGELWDHDAAVSTPREQSLASVGAGVRTNFNENLYGYLEVGVPLTHDVAGDDKRDPRVFFSITGRY